MVGNPPGCPGEAGGFSCARPIRERPEPIFVQDDKPYRGILRTAELIDADLIVTAARGRALGAALFLGSSTERLIEHADVPVVAVKKKGDGLSLLEALLSS